MICDMIIFRDTHHYFVSKVVLINDTTWLQIFVVYKFHKGPDLK